MSKKSAKIQNLISGLSHPEYDPHYLGFFACFNQKAYYEAHDVLEELWLAEGKSGSNYFFYKGLIQTAGAFVHLKKQYQEPLHHVHGKRLAPGTRLFRLALVNLAAYPENYRGVKLKAIRSMNQNYIQALETSPGQNPWSPEAVPYLSLPL